MRSEMTFLTAPSRSEVAAISSKLTVSAHDSPQGYWCGYNRSSAAAPRGRPEFCLFTHACSILSLRSVILRSSVLICLGTQAVSSTFNNSDSFQFIFRVDNLEFSVIIYKFISGVITRLTILYRLYSTPLQCNFIPPCWRGSVLVLLRPPLNLRLGRKKPSHARTATTTGARARDPRARPRPRPASRSTSRTSATAC
eukprot:COSAG02_NODE_1403_length_12811_cov_8.982536_12_plen_197_part_00